MPRVPPSLLRTARATSPNLARLLPACRDVESARNELRWLREHALASAPTRRASTRSLREMCERRQRGEPLQYILGTQPFGNLDIECASGVLIPRPETEAYTVHLAHLLKTGQFSSLAGGGPALRIADFCTGTGCIPLLLFSLLSPSFPTLHVHGVDISPQALALSRQNLHSALSKSHVTPQSPGQSVTFHSGDALSASWLREELPNLIPGCDVLVSNPPYVCPTTWQLGRKQMSYSTRKFEPKLALVPRHVPEPPPGCRPEDVFYGALLDAASVLKPSVVLLEFGDAAQGTRILEFALRHPFSRDAEFEFWRDYPDLPPVGDEAEETESAVRVRDQAGVERAVPVRGSGKIRSVIIRKPKTGAV